MYMCTHMCVYIYSGSQSSDGNDNDNDNRRVVMNSLGRRVVMIMIMTVIITL